MVVGYNVAVSASGSWVLMGFDGWYGGGYNVAMDSASASGMMMMWQRILVPQWSVAMGTMVLVEAMASGYVQVGSRGVTDVVMTAW